MDIDADTLICKDSSCPAQPFWLALLDKIDALLVEVKAAHQTLKDREPKAKNSSKAAADRLRVNGLVLALQVEHPDRIWTAESFAGIIGCTGAAVRKTQAWKVYRERLQSQKQKHPQRKGYKDKRGNLEAFDEGG